MPMYSYIPADAVSAVMKDGLHSGKSLLSRPDLLEIAAKGRSETPEKFRKNIEDKLKTWKAYALLGPNAVFHKIPASQRLEDNHPTKTRKLVPIAIDIERLMKDQPKTKLYGMELKPYVEGKSKPGERHHYIGSSKVEQLHGMTPEKYWSSYNDQEKGGLYAPDVPHVAIHTPSGHVDQKYLTLAGEFGGWGDFKFHIPTLWKHAKGLEVESVPLKPLFDKHKNEKIWRIGPDTKATLHDVVTGKAKAHPDYEHKLEAHRSRVSAADLSHPIILDNEGTVLDGLHRLVKAVQEGHKTVKVVRFAGEIPEAAVVARSREKTAMNRLLPSFYDELTKIAARLTPAQANEKVGVHHETQDWKLFEKNLKNKSFRQAVLVHPESNAKLKRYTKALGEFKMSDVLGVVPSRTSNKLHKIKKLPNGRLACSCKDWQYAHSHKSSKSADCAHIQEFKGGMQ